MRHVRLLALALVLAGCSKEDPAGPGAGNATTLSGSLAASDGRTGSLTLTGQVPAANLAAAQPRFDVAGASRAPEAVINLTGTVSLSDGTTATLAGTWDNVSGALSVSGGGFTFSGTLTAGHLSGATFTGPSITGVFSLQLSTSDADAVVYCGTYTGREPEDLPNGNPGTGPDNGTWNLVVGPTAVDVVVLSDEGEPTALGGTRSGNAITLTIPGGQAAGTISASGDYVNGTYTITGGLSGTFQGSQAACTATVETGTIASITVNHPGIQAGSTAVHARLAFDSTLVFATAKDASGNFVAAPNLDWSFTGPARSNNAVTPKGQKWMVWTGTGSTSVTVKSHDNPAVAVTFTILAQ